MKKYILDSWNHNVLVKFNKYIPTFGIQIVMSKYRHFNSFMKMFLSSLNRTVSVLHNINLTNCIRTNICDLYAVKLKQITVSHQNRPLPAVYKGLSDRELDHIFI